MQWNWCCCYPFYISIVENIALKSTIFIQRNNDTDHQRRQYKDNKNRGNNKEVCCCWLMIESVCLMFNKNQQQSNDVYRQ